MPTRRLPWWHIVGTTIAVQLVVFAMPATVAWRSTLDSTAYVPFVSLGISVVIGAVLLLVRGQRRVGGWIVVGTVLAAALDIGLTLALILAYSSANPGWDLS